MAFDRFLIAPLNSGLDTSLKSWLTPEDSFTILNNAYVWRGRVVKRFGSSWTGVNQLTSRLRIAVATTDGAGAASGTVPGIIFGIGQMFSIGLNFYTVNALGAPANMLSTGGATIHTFNTTTGAFNFTGAALLTPVYFYPAEPVMGLTIYGNGDITNQPTYAFDTQFAYTFNGTSWNRSGTGVTPVWSGTDSDFFWAGTWTQPFDAKKLLFVTNFNSTVLGSTTSDPLWYFDGTTWIIWKPKFLVAGTADQNIINTARLIVFFKNRLLLLNTIETTTAPGKAYGNRCRYSQNGSPVAPEAYYESNQVGYLGGGYLDAATDEKIVTADFIKDHLIVYFEQSTWELVYTGNEIQPFIWQRLNTELGARSTFSVIPFDKYALAIGNVGVHSCNGSNVERIDNKIPQDIFNIENNNAGSFRVAGIRDYYAEMAYWTFPSTEDPLNTYPDRVLVYNYQNGSWSYNHDCITAFGYFEQQKDRVWQDQTITWEQTDFTWSSGIEQANERQIIAGNQQGYVFLVDSTINVNAAVLQITDVNTTTGAFKVINHNLRTNEDSYSEYVKLTAMTGDTNWNGKIYSVERIDIDTIYLWWLDLTDPAHPVLRKVVPSSYNGAGQLARVSNIKIQGKQWNPYVSSDRNVYVAKINFGVTATDAGEITVDYSASSATETLMLYEGEQSKALLGTGTLTTKPYALAPFEKNQDRLWHPIYFQTEGTCIQIYLYLSDMQMRTVAIAEAPFELEGMVLYTKATTSRMQ